MRCWATRATRGCAPASDLPWYRPRPEPDAREYYNVGHDCAVSVFSRTRLHQELSNEDGRHFNLIPDVPTDVPIPGPEDNRTADFFFGGVGDARHLWVSLIDLHRRLAHPAP